MSFSIEQIASQLPGVRRGHNADSDGFPKWEFLTPCHGDRHQSGVFFGGSGRAHCSACQATSEQILLMCGIDPQEARDARLNRGYGKPQKERTRFSDWNPFAPGQKQVSSFPRPVSKPDAPVLSWSAVSAQRVESAAENPDSIEWLANNLKVTASSLHALSVGWFPDEAAVLDRERYNPAHYTFPERDAEGRIIGLATRTRSGGKYQETGSKRGLTYSPAFLLKSGTRIIVEGPSDVAALYSLGIQSAIGRPSNSGGVEYLIDLLRQDAIAGEEIVVVGENDQKPSGMWPGRDGAKSVSERLSGAFGKPIRYVLPPNGFKDVRDWINKNITPAELDNPDNVAEVRERLFKEFGVCTTFRPITSPQFTEQINIEKDDISYSSYRLESSTKAWIDDRLNKRLNCPKSKTLLLKGQGRETGNGQAIKRGCGRCECAACICRKRAAWLEHIEGTLIHHMGTAAGSGVLGLPANGQVFYAEIDHSQYAAVRQSIKRECKKAELPNLYHAVKNGDRYHIFAAVEFTIGTGEGVQTPELFESIERMTHVLTEACASIPLGTRRPVNSGESWSKAEAARQIAKRAEDCGYEKEWGLAKICAGDRFLPIKTALNAAGVRFLNKRHEHPDAVESFKWKWFPHFTDADYDNAFAQLAVGKVPFFCIGPCNPPTWEDYANAG